MATETGDVWTFTIEPYVDMPPSITRPPFYDPNWVWDPVTGAWTITDPDLIMAGGGRYKNRFVAIGHNVIYFGDI